MANIGFTESASALSGPNQQKEVASGSVAAISGQVHYRFLTSGRYAWYGQATFPLMAGEGTYLSSGAGLEYYWGTPARSVLKDLTTSFILTPRMRYFLSGGVNLAYISYDTKTAKKNDTLVEIELGGGMSYKFKKWTLRASAGIARGTGIVTSTMGMKAMVGGIIFLD